MECVFQCGEYIARKIMKQHCQQQCNNAKRIQDDKCAITCIAVQENLNTDLLFCFACILTLNLNV